MTPRRAMVSMAVVLGGAALVLAVFDRPVLAGVAAVACLAQVLALVMAPRGRTVVTVVFTDVVESTRVVHDMGDTAWQRLFDRYATSARREFKRVPVSVVKDLGDGFLAATPILVAAPGRVVDAVLRLADEARSSGLEVRTGVHVGECTLTGGEVRGLAVHIAARLMESAAANEILISGTVRELLGGTELRIVAVGEREFKGVDEPVRAFAVSR